jgi:ADP-heptose:LPS heptosyltransferase
VVVDLVGRTSIPVARAVVERLDAFLCNDSGLLHVAATTRTPVVAVFGPSDPREACPRRAGVEWVWEPARATPCLDARDGRLRPCVVPCCIERASVAAVVARLAHALGGAVHERVDAGLGVAPSGRNGPCTSAGRRSGLV